MLIIVLGINVILAMLCLVVAWQVWQLRQVLGQVADTLMAVADSTHNVLYDAPEALASGHQGIQQVRDRLSQLDVQLHRALQVLSVLRRGHSRWRQQQQWTAPRRHRQ